ncbi:condensation domain-containing protein, partial [Streptomyces rubiginosohelvolus]
MIPLSYAQARLWFHEQIEGRSSAYNLSYALRLHGDPDAAALRHALADACNLTPPVPGRPAGPGAAGHAP